jgi:glycosyltransferase involved in cell wall biosynthesis
MGKINLLHLITELDIGGAEKLLLSLVRKLDSDRYNVIVAYMKGEGKLAKDFKDSGIRVFDLKMKNRIDARAIIYLYRLLKRENIKILHTHLIQADICGFLAGKTAGVPVIISTRHNPDEFRKKFSIPVWLDGIFANHSDRIIAVSNAVKDFLIKHEKISPQKFAVIHNGIEPGEFIFESGISGKKKESGISLSSPVAGCIGRFDEQKGHMCFLEAIPQILEYFPDAKFIFVGEGPLRRKAERRSKELKIDRNVIFTGIRRDIPGILAIMDIFILPSIFEGFGIVLLEAMAAGKPVIASRVGGIPEIINHNLNGILVEPANSAEIAAAILNLLKEPAKMRRMGEAGREEVKKRFSADTMAKKIETLYNEIIFRHADLQ